ncbi:MAG: ROK family glucokinase [Rubrobacteridae bacterium]|nr:ROK family glucokinase [Rubrobacteridae bacterium]
MIEIKQAKAAIAVDIGGTKISAAVINDSGELITYLKTNTPGTVSEITDTVINVTVDLIEFASRVAQPIGIGLAVAGTVDWERGVVIQSPNLPYNDLDLKRIVGDSCSLPVYLDNDGNLATLGEKYYGSAKNAKNVVGLTLGTGIGAGIIIDNNVYRGASGSAAELGHMVIDAHGPKCTCGSSGCFEEMASGRALIRYAREKLSGKTSLVLELAGGNIEKITGSMITEAALAGDSLALGCFEEVGYWLGIGLNNIVNIFNPEIIVIGGGMADAGELVLKCARDIVANCSLNPNKDIVSIVKAKLGNNAGLFGAAALVLNK